MLFEKISRTVKRTSLAVAWLEITKKRLRLRSAAIGEGATGDALGPSSEPAVAVSPLTRACSYWLTTSPAAPRSRAVPSMATSSIQIDAFRRKANWPPPGAQTGPWKDAWDSWAGLVPSALTSVAPAVPASSSSLPSAVQAMPVGCADLASSVAPLPSGAER